jgi:hypothetical protein
VRFSVRGYWPRQGLVEYQVRSETILCPVFKVSTLPREKQSNSNRRGKRVKTMTKAWETTPTADVTAVLQSISQPVAPLADRKTESSGSEMAKSRLRIQVIRAVVKTE